MWIIASLAFMPLAAVVFGALAVPVLVFPELTDSIGMGAGLLYGAAALSIILSVPLAWLVARRMATARDRRLLQR